MIKKQFSYFAEGCYVGCPGPRPAAEGCHRWGYARCRVVIVAYVLPARYCVVARKGGGWGTLGSRCGVCVCASTVYGQVPYAH